MREKKKRIISILELMAELESKPGDELYNYVIRSAAELLKKSFLPDEAMSAVCVAGQKDSRFKWGEVIRYSPSEIYKILYEAVGGEADVD